MTVAEVPTEGIPEVALERHEPYGNGWKGVIERRKRAIQEVAGLLLRPGIQVSPDTASITARLRQIGQSIAARLWLLHAQLVEYERAVAHIYEELELTRERLSDLPPFRYDETRDIAKARSTVEQLRSQLGHELRETHRRWLEARGDAENNIVELFADYTEVLSQVQAMTPQFSEAPSLSDLLRFLTEPPAQNVIIEGPPEALEHDDLRIP